MTAATGPVRLMSGIESVQALNLALARALGVADGTACAGLTLVLAPGQLPVVTARFFVQTADGLAEVVERCTIVPAPELVGTEGAPQPQEIRDAA